MLSENIKITKPADASLSSDNDNSGNLFAVREVFLPKDNQVWLNYFVEGITLEETLIVPLQRSVR